MKKIIAIQMYANKNESLSAFKESVKALIHEGYVVEAIANDEQATILGDVKGVNVHRINNEPQPNKVFQFYMFIRVQILLFAKVLKMINSDDVVYINSIYSIAPAIVAKIKGNKLICHLHSAKQHFNLVDRAFIAMINKMADQLIFPSVSLKDKFAFNVNRQTVIYNAPAEEFINQIDPLMLSNRAKKFTVLMIASSDDKQAIGKFTQVASQLPLLNFELLLDDWTASTIALLHKHNRPANLRILPENNNLHRFYERADVLVNLSADEFNTSGDTHVLQAMYHGVPVIVPAKGGLRELISLGKHGLAISNEQTSTIVQTIQQLSSNALIHKTLSAACIAQAKRFTPDQFRKQFSKLFSGYRPRPYDNIIQLFGMAYLNKDASVFSDHAV